MDQAKYVFLTEEFTPLLKELSGNAVARWGKMNGQQMVEHVTAFFQVSTEKIRFPLSVPAVHLPKYKEFLLSDKEFRENTKAPAGVVPDEPYPIHCESMAAAVDELEEAIRSFREHFEKNPGLKTMHPAFGDLNFEEWVLLHYKHVTHHLKQFGLISTTI